MRTVARYSVTFPLSRDTSNSDTRPHFIPRTVFPASCTAFFAAAAKLVPETPTTSITFWTMPDPPARRPLSRISKLRLGRPVAPLTDPASLPPAVAVALLLRPRVLRRPLLALLPVLAVHHARRDGGGEKGADVPNPVPPPSDVCETP